VAWKEALALVPDCRERRAQLRRCLAYLDLQKWSVPAEVTTALRDASGEPSAEPSMEPSRDPSAQGSHEGSPDVSPTPEPYPEVLPGAGAGSPPVVPQGGTPPGFTQFWLIYPNRVGKDAALKAWSKKKCEPIAGAVVAALKEQLPYLEREEGKFVPNPATWLSQGRWKDEPAHRNGHDPKRPNAAWERS
jgi:hypothetical protein